MGLWPNGGGEGPFDIRAYNTYLIDLKLYPT
jgi:hypothetical protein